MPRLIKVNEATAIKRAVTFHIVDATDGLTPETGEAGGQPQIAVNMTAFTDTGIGTLSHIGNGRYYALLAAGTVSTADTWIETRFKNTTTAESVGDAVFVVNFDPADHGGYVADAVWDEAQSGHTSAGTFGKYLDAAVSSVTAPTAAQVADAVWDETTTAHTTAATFGAVVYEVLGLSLKNCALTALTFDSSSRPLTGRKRVYDTAAHAATDDGVTGLLYTYTWVTTYNSAGYPITHVETLQ